MMRSALVQSDRPGRKTALFYLHIYIAAHIASGIRFAEAFLWNKILLSQQSESCLMLKEKFT